jgi:hypothetical protein
MNGMPNIIESSKFYEISSIEQGDGAADEFPDRLGSPMPVDPNARDPGWRSRQMIGGFQDMDLIIRNRRQIGQVRYLERAYGSPGRFEAARNDLYRHANHLHLRHKRVFSSTAFGGAILNNCWIASPERHRFSASTSAMLKIAFRLLQTRSKASLSGRGAILGDCAARRCGLSEMMVCWERLETVAQVTLPLRLVDC